MTVNMLIQIDKLVQLLESPVFTCKSHNKYLDPLLTKLRSSAPTTRTGKIPSSIQVPLWGSDAPATVVCIRGTQEPFEQR